MPPPPDSPPPAAQHPKDASAAAPAPEGFWATFRHQIRASLPTQDDLARHRWLRPIASRLYDPVLWKLKAEPVARGVAIGIFWAFAVPVAQILFAAAHCVWWRAHIPVAAGVTLITNPLTVGGWLWLAYQLGKWLVPGSAALAITPDGAVGWWAWIGSIGAPTLIGMATFAVGGAALGYVLARAVGHGLGRWRLQAARDRRRQRQGGG